MTTTAHCRLTGKLTVALPPERAYRLFTPRGEQTWTPHWQPRFPAPTTDDTTPGTVFQTHTGDQTTTWVVTDSTPGRRIRYARVTPATTAGTVTVIDADGDSHVTVTYDLTALTRDATRHLEEFAAGYPAFLHSWQQAIAASLHHPNRQR